MNELLDKIIAYANSKPDAQFSAPEAQCELHLTYRELTEALNTLQGKGVVKFLGGMRYEFFGNKNSEGCNYGKDYQRIMNWAECLSDLERLKEELFMRRHRDNYLDEDEDDGDEDDEDDGDIDDEEDEDDEDDGDIDDEEDEDDEDEDENEDNEKVEELRKKVLKYCIEQNAVSLLMIKQQFDLGYLKTFCLIKWMEDSGYVVTLKDGQKKIAVTMDDFNLIYGGSNRLNAEERQKKAVKALALTDVLKKVAAQKNKPVTAGEAPRNSLWPDKEVFKQAVCERLKKIIISDRRMGRHGAIKLAETFLQAVRDTHDEKMVQVYERIVYELKATTDAFYRELKKEYFG